ncbi:MAG TPA: hypothetical protein VMF89_20935, partial [Polyangiales bacterium]|nr:hypothetical protein [Polyangiales bacterium]
MTAFQIEPILSQLEAALATRDIPRAWQLVAPLSAARTQDPRVGSVWLTMLRITPARESLVTEATEILEQWPMDNSLQLLGCDALIRAAELVAPDVPVSDTGAAVKAIEVAEKNLARLSAAERSDKAIGG